MATYDREYYYNPQRRKKQRYALIERVVDFAVVGSIDLLGDPIVRELPRQRVVILEIVVPDVIERLVAGRPHVPHDSCRRCGGDGLGNKRLL